MVTLFEKAFLRAISYMFFTNSKYTPFWFHRRYLHISFKVKCIEKIWFDYLIFGLFSLHEFRAIHLKNDKMIHFIEHMESTQLFFFYALDFNSICFVIQVYLIIYDTHNTHIWRYETLNQHIFVLIRSNHSIIIASSNYSTYRSIDSPNFGLIPYSGVLLCRRILSSPIFHMFVIIRNLSDI